MELSEMMVMYLHERQHAESQRNRGKRWCFHNQEAYKSDCPVGAGTMESNVSFWECGGNMESMAAVRERSPGWEDFSSTWQRKVFILPSPVLQSPCRALVTKSNRELLAEEKQFAESQPQSASPSRVVNCEFGAEKPYLVPNTIITK